MSKQQRFVDLDVAKKEFNAVARAQNLDPAVIQLFNNTLRKSITYNAKLLVQAEWVDDGGITRCSNCKDRPVEDIRSYFCPTCGAKMKNSEWGDCDYE